jgi:transposase
VEQALRYAGRGHPKIKNWDEIVKLYEQGYSSVELSKMFNVTPQSIIQYLKQLGKARNRHEAQKLRWVKHKKTARGAQLVS